jgi:hypothetical protein
MGKKVYITFDDYYKVDEYNSFITAAKNNSVKFDEFIRIRPPYSRFLYIDEKDLPVFVNFDYASVSDEQFLVSAVKPIYPNEAYLLKRREGEDISYYKYITPKPMKNAHKEDHFIAFKGYSDAYIANISKKLGKAKIYKWGHADKKGYDIYFSFNPYLRGIIDKTIILMDYGKGTPKNVPKNPGDIEYELNYKVLVSEKLMNKSYLLEYWSEGKKHPLKRESFL